MPSIGTPEQSNVVTWKVISTGTAIVVAIFVIFWLARTAASERGLVGQQRPEAMAAESSDVCARRSLPACAADTEAAHAGHERRIALASEPF